MAAVVNDRGKAVKPTRNPNVQTKLLPDGHIVLFAQQHDWAHTLTPLGGIAWEFCDGQHSFDEIVDCVVETAGIQDSATIKTDLTKLFEELSGSGLLTSA